MTGLDPSRIAQVDIILAPTAVAGRNFGNLLLLGDSDVIDKSERIKDYSGIDGVISDFGSTAPETLAAQIFFSQVPQPSVLKIGRWAQAATSGILHGGVLSSSQQELSNFLGVGNGGFTISIDGTAQNVTGLSLYSATNMNGIASAVTAGLIGATCTWDSVNGRFDIKSTSTGAGVKAYGYISFTGMPSDGNSFTINGTTLTLKTSGATGAQVNIGSNVAETMAAVCAYFAANPVSGVTVTQVQSFSAIVESTTVGTAGNSKTLAKVGTNLGVTGATLANGANASTVSYATPYASATDISTLLGLTAAMASTPVPGGSAETVVEAVQACASKSVDWYGLYVAATTAVTDQNHLDIAAYIESATPSRMYGITSQSSGTLDSTDTSCLAYMLKASNYRRTFVQYSSDSPYAGISIFGREFTVNFGGVNTTLTVKFKTEPGIVAETLTTSQANAAEAKNANVFVNYSNGAAIVEQGVMSSGHFLDEVHGLDWLQNACQTAVFNLLYTALTKIPQTDHGMTSLVSAVASTMDQAVRNGLLAPGQWNAEGFGELKRGDYLPNGYYIYASPIRLQSQADREARKATPIQVAVKMAGAVHSAVIQINVNR